MFGVSTPEMVEAAAKAECLGSLALADLSAEKSVELIRKTKSLTNRPFAVNIFVHQIPEITDELKQQYSKTKKHLENLAHENNMEAHLLELKDSKLVILNGNTLDVTEKTGNAMTIQVATSQLILDEDSTLTIHKQGNVNTIVLIDSKMTIDRGFIDTISSGNYDNDIYVDDASRLHTYNGYINSSGRSNDSLTLNGTAILTGTSIVPKINSRIGISLYNGARLTMKGVTNHPATVGSSSARYGIAVHDIDGSYAGGLPSAGGEVTLFAVGSEGACAAGYLFSYSKESTGTGQTSQNDYALINANESAALAPIISKLNASNWLCNKL